MSQFLPEPKGSSQPSISPANPQASDQDIALMQRVLDAASARPDLIPEKFMSYVVDFIQTSNLMIPIGQVFGYSRASVHAGDYKISTQVATHSDGGGGTWYLCDGSALPSTEAALIALVGATVPDARGRSIVALGTHADVNSIGDNDGVSLANRRPKHNSTVVDPQHNHGGVTGSKGFSNSGTVAGAIGLLQNASTDEQGAHTHTIPSGGTGITVGPGGTAPIDTPSYIVPGSLFIHSLSHPGFDGDFVARVRLAER